MLTLCCEVLQSFFLIFHLVGCAVLHFHYIIVFIQRNNVSYTKSVSCCIIFTQSVFLPLRYFLPNITSAFVFSTHIFMLQFFNKVCNLKLIALNHIHCLKTKQFKMSADIIVFNLVFPPIFITWNTSPLYSLIALSIYKKKQVGKVTTLSIPFLTICHVI